MKNKGQLHLEAILCIALIFSLIAASIGGLNSLKHAVEKSNAMLLAEAKAQKCSVAANALFANSGQYVLTREKCYSGKEHEVKSVFKGKEKKAFSIAEGISSTQLGEKTILEVKVNKHYG